MKTKLALVAVAATLYALPASASGVCLRQATIYNWNAPNDTTLIVEDDFHKKFKITLLSTCLSLRYKERIGFKVFGGTGLSCVTSGDSIITGSSTGPQHCAIKTVELYTPEMERADKAAKAAKDAAH